MNRTDRIDGFYHEKLIVVPQSIIDNSILNPIVASLYITDIGYFPHAKDHHRERPEGTCDNIFILCVEGKGSIQIEGKDLTLEANDFCIIPANATHLYKADKVNPWSIYWFHFNGTLVEAYQDIILRGNPTGKVDVLQHSKIIQRFNTCYKLLEKGYGIETMIAVTTQLGLLLSGLRYDSETIDLISDPTNPINLCIDYMTKHIDQKIQIATLTTMTNLSRSHLIQRFREQTGFTPIDYMIHLKIQKACSLLDTTSFSIKEIAYHMGYDDPLYFSRIFSKIMGTSPRQYRLIEKG